MRREDAFTTILQVRSCSTRDFKVKNVHSICLHYWKHLELDFSKHYRTQYIVKTLPRQTSVFSIIPDLIPGFSLDFSLEKGETCRLSEVPGGQAVAEEGAEPRSLPGCPTIPDQENLTLVRMCAMVRKIMLRGNWGPYGKKTM